MYCFPFFVPYDGGKAYFEVYANSEAEARSKLPIVIEQDLNKAGWRFHPEQLPKATFEEDDVAEVDFIDPPHAVHEHGVDFATTTRRKGEIHEALEVLSDQIWYDRYKSRMQRIETGQQEEDDPEIAKQAKAGARRVERRRGKKNLGPWTAFEWGMLNGKMSALRWVLGEEWDFLDT